MHTYNPVWGYVNVDEQKSISIVMTEAQRHSNSKELIPLQPTHRPELVRLIVLLILAFIFPATLLHGQVPSFTPVAPQALSNSLARCFHKDSRGFVWMGTNDGLIRYDGSNVYRYSHSHNDNNSIAHNTINAIIEDRNNRLWIGTAQGLCIYDQELDNFINVDSIKGSRNFLNNRYITDLAFDSNGKLWVGTHSGGINVYDPVKREYTYIGDSPTAGILPSTNFVSALRQVDNEMWCATKGGLLLFNTATKKLQPLNRNDFDFADDQIADLVVDKAGNLWIGTVKGEIIRVLARNGYYSFDKILSGAEFGESTNRLVTMCFDLKGRLVVGGENSGFSFVDVKTNKVDRLLAEEGNIQRLPTNSISSIYADGSGIIWIGTINNGVFLMDNTPKKFATAGSICTSDPELHNKEARSFSEDEQGNVWIAYNEIGLAFFSAKSRTLHNYEVINHRLKNKNVSSVICDRNGDLWLGTLGKGVYKIDPVNHQLTNYPVYSEGFGNDQVFCLYEDKSGTIWAGTSGSGLFFFNTARNAFISATEFDQPNHIPHTAYISSMMEDSDGTFWVGTLYGLYELRRNKGNSFTYRVYVPTDTVRTISGGQVQDLVEDKDRNLWIATSDNGLSVKRRGTGKFESFEVDNGLISNTIRAITVDRQGNLWMSGNRGLLKRDMRSGIFTNYTSEDGLSSDKFYTNACLRSSTGELFFGSAKGFEAFYPDDIKTTQKKPTIYLSDLRINNQSVRPGAVGSPLEKHISLTKEIHLSYDQRSFMIDFVALGFNQSATYCYKLEGFDEEWNCSSSGHSATYTNIDPGHYVFLVKAANREGVWTNEPIRLEITIDQVFWKTWWAYCIYMAVISLLVYVLMKIRIERLKMRNQLMLERVEREREHELSESKTQFFTNVSHEFRTPLSLVLIPLESLMNTNEVPPALRERIFTAHKNADRMMRLVNELMDFNKLESGNLELHIQHGELGRFITETSSAFNEMSVRRNIRFSVNSTAPTLMGWFDKDKLERIIFNVLSNAFKFTADGGEITLTVSTKHSIIADGTLCNCLELVIVDDGIGIMPDELPRIFEKFYQAKSSTKISSPGTGIGLSLTKALVELHQGRIVAESIPDHATTFTILLPIDANAFQVNETVETPADVLYTKRNDSYNPSEPDTESHDASDLPKILVVEDNTELREYLAAELRKEYFVLEAADGEEGFEIAVKHGPDLIISDIMMPRRDGNAFCLAIKGNINTSHIPFVLLTAKATVDDQIHGVNSGADLYITKPFNIRYLMAHIHQIIASRQLLYSRFSQDVYLMPSKIANNEIDQAFLQKAIDYIIQNLQDSQLSVDSMADLFNLSRMQVYRKIKALTGKSVVEFIRTIRVKQAIKLMDTHKYTLSEIAFQTGFSSSSYFTRCFKDEYGKTPSEYLQQS